MIAAGIVGLGWWGRIITATLADSRNVRLVAAADVNLDAETFADWRSGRTSLAAEDLQTLRLFWYMTLHLLSFLGSDETRLRDLFHQFLPAPRR